MEHRVSFSKGKLVCDMYAHIKAFEVKLATTILPKTSQLRNQWPHCQLKSRWKRWKCLRQNLVCRFREAHVHAKEIRLFQNPFTVDIDKALPSCQFELAELQNCDVLKDAFKPNNLIEFYAALPNETYPNIKRHAMKMSTLFDSTYICEQTFSHSDEHLHQSLRLAMTGMEPASQKQAHSSH
uniref:HAT C-terminal dimerisation domain-containing protein n=1 Tax=Sander lucioperca TaxID=283035 RepID=A0A8C9ZRL4_SANLU